VPAQIGAPAKTAVPPAAGAPAHKPRICVNLAGAASGPQPAGFLSTVLFAAAAVPTSDAARYWCLCWRPGNHALFPELSWAV